MASRRIQRYNADGSNSSLRRSSEIVNRRTINSSNPGEQRNRNLPPRSNSTEGLQRPIATIERIRERTKRGAPDRTRSADKALHTIKSRLSVGREDSKECTEALDYRGRRIERPHQSPSRTAPTDIAERLRERREARERQKKEIAKKYDLKSSALELGSTYNGEATGKCSIDMNSTAKAEEESSDVQTMSPDIEVYDEAGGDHTSQGWSIRLCVISAMDLPSNVVPNMPLCPVLKLGLVQLPSNVNADERSVTSKFIEKMGNRSIETIKSANVRSTTPKILSKRVGAIVSFGE